MKFSPFLVFSLSPPFFFFLFPLLFSHTALFWIERLHLISWYQQCCHYWFWTSVFTACLAWLSTLSLPRMPVWAGSLNLRIWFYHCSWMYRHYFCVISSWSYFQSVCKKTAHSLRSDILHNRRSRSLNLHCFLFALIWSNSVSSKHRRENRPFHSWKKLLLVLSLRLLDFGVLILSQQARGTFLVWATVSMTCQIHPTLDLEFCFFLSKHDGFSPVSAS